MADNRERDRMVFETTEVMKRAIRLRAAADGVQPAAVINAALAAHLPGEIAIAQERLQGGNDEGQKSPRKRQGESP